MCASKNRYNSLSSFFFFKLGSRPASLIARFELRWRHCGLHNVLPPFPFLGRERDFVAYSTNDSTRYAVLGVPSIRSGDVVTPSLPISAVFISPFVHPPPPPVFMASWASLTFPSLPLPLQSQRIRHSRETFGANLPAGFLMS